MADRNMRRGAPVEGDDRQDEATQLDGAVRESPRSPDETDSSDRADATNPRAREERNVTSASGLAADDPDTGEERKKRYKEGAVLVSKID